MSRNGYAVLIILVAILVITSLLFGGVMVLWNWTMPDIFGLPEITFLQAAGITALSWILTGASGSVSSD